MIGFPSAPARLFEPLAGTLAPAEGRHRMRLADAVRLSANFPWGFEVGTFPREPALAAVAAGAVEPYKVIDGGVRDNTGLDSIMLLLDRIETLARAGQSALNLEARRVRNLLLLHGVVLLEIDSGAKPTRGGILQLLPVLSEPLDALSYARYGGEDDLRRAHVAAINDALMRMGQHDSLDPGLRVVTATRRQGVFHVQLVCNKTDDVMTAWALGPEDKAKLLTMFVIERERVRPLLRDALIQINGERAAAQAVRGASDDVQRRYAQAALADVARFTRKIEAEEDDASTRQNLYGLLAGATSAHVEPPPAPAPPAAPPPVAPEPPSSSAAAPASSGAPVEPVRAPASTSTSPRTEVASGCDAAGASRQGWVYLGQRADGRWKTRYFSFDGSDPARLERSHVLTAIGRANLRQKMPDAQANFGAVAHVLRPDEKVDVCDLAQQWSGDSGYWWVKVQARPPAGRL